MFTNMAGKSSGKAKGKGQGKGRPKTRSQPQVTENVGESPGTNPADSGHPVPELAMVPGPSVGPVLQNTQENTQTPNDGVVLGGGQESLSAEGLQGSSGPGITSSDHITRVVRNENREDAWESDSGSGFVGFEDEASGGSGQDA